MEWFLPYLNGSERLIVIPAQEERFRLFPLFTAEAMYFGAYMKEWALLSEKGRADRESRIRDE